MQRFEYRLAKIAKALPKRRSWQSIVGERCMGRLLAEGGRMLSVFSAFSRVKDDWEFGGRPAITDEEILERMTAGGPFPELADTGPPEMALGAKSGVYLEWRKLTRADIKAAFERWNFQYREEAAALGVPPGLIEGELFPEIPDVLAVAGT